MPQDAKDPEGGSKDTAKPDNPGMKLPVWDEPSTEDEGSKATRVVDASAALQAFRESERLAAELTPAVGATYVAAFIDDETTAPPPNGRAEYAVAATSDVTIHVEETSLSDEELAEIEEAETQTDLRASQLPARYDPASVPRLAIAPGALCDVQIDHRAGYVLALIDGVSSLGDIHLLCAHLPDFEALLAELLERGVITLDRPR